MGPPAKKPKTETAAVGLVKAVQRLVTAARKAKVRMRKLAAEQEQIEANWTQFQQDLRAKFVKGRENYKADKEKVTQALVESENAQARAFQEQEAMNNPGSLVERKEPELPAAIAQEWEALLGAEDSDEEMTQAALEAVRQKMKEALGAPMTPPRTSDSLADKCSAEEIFDFPAPSGHDDWRQPPGLWCRGYGDGRRWRSVSDLADHANVFALPAAGENKIPSVARRTSIKEVGKVPRKMEVGGA